MPIIEARLSTFYFRRAGRIVLHESKFAATSCRKDTRDLLGHFGEAVAESVDD